MSDDYQITAVTGGWRIEFKRRGFSRDFNTREEADAVIRADAVYSKAEKLLLYSPESADRAKSLELARELQIAIEGLKGIGVNAFTLRELERVAENLERI